MPAQSSRAGMDIDVFTVLTNQGEAAVVIYHVVLTAGLSPAQSRSFNSAFTDGGGGRSLTPAQSAGFIG